MKIATITVTENTNVAGYGIFQAGDYTLEIPADYDPDLIDAYDIVCDSQIQRVTQERALAHQIVDQMNDEDRETFARDAWFEGVSNNCLDGESPDLVLDEIEVLLGES